MEWKGFVFIYSLPKSETREWIGLSGPQLLEKERDQEEKGWHWVLLLLLSLWPREPPLVSHFIAWKSFIFESKRFGALMKSILVDIILSKDFIS